MNFISKKHFIFFVITLPVLLFVFCEKTSTTSAQTGDLSLPVEIKQQLDINISPENPKPGETVIINIESYSFDLDSTDIQWLINSKQFLRGVGEKRFTFNVGSNTESRVVLNIYPKNQSQITKTFVFNPSNIDLLWQAETYTPPFYKGKALFSAESDVTMVAIPNFIDGGSRTADSNVVYKWSIDREVQGDYSGRGKNYFKYTADILSQDKTIEVEAYPTTNVSKKGVGSVDLSKKNSFVLFYEDNPLNGVMFNYSLINKIDLQNRDEAKISVFPFNFSTQSKSEGLDYTWYINSEKISIPSNTNTITIKKNANEATNLASVLVEITNPNHIMQSTKNALNFIFNNK